MKKIFNLKKTYKINKFLKIIGIAVLIILIALSSLIKYKTYKPMNEALDAMKSANIIEEENTIIFNPPNESKANIVFYQGGLVKTESYAVLGKMLAEKGIRVFIPKMPLNLAIINTKAFDKIYDKYFDGKDWYIGGHSLGGASAAIYVSNNAEKVKGIFFLGSYPSEQNDLKNINIKVLSINASNDEVINKEKYNSSKNLLPLDTNYIQIDGGNHSGYGYYGLQAGDGNSYITREEQHNIIVNEIIKMIDNIP